MKITTHEGAGMNIDGNVIAIKIELDDGEVFISETQKDDYSDSILPLELKRLALDIEDYLLLEVPISI